MFPNERDVRAASTYSKFTLYLTLIVAGPLLLLLSLSLLSGGANLELAPLVLVLLWLTIWAFRALRHKARNDENSDLCQK